MLTQTKAIVLHKLNYSETSFVVQVYTLNYGKVGLLVQGVKKRKSRTKAALFEPLSIIDLVGNFTDTEKLIRPREIKLHTPFISIQSEISKRTLVLFLSEILHKCIKLPEPDPSMYRFIEESLLFLEQSKTNNANFHLAFLLELSKHLGFHPQPGTGEYFDMQEGNFTNAIPSSHLYLQADEKDLFSQTLGTKIAKSATLKLTANQRKTVLNSLIKYYQTHIPGLGEIKSHIILESIFN